jgi:hypothetical protein
MTSFDSPPQLFISYASRDRDKVVELARALDSCGVSIWRDQDQILGGENYGPKIVRGIRSAKAVLVCCSDAAMRSKNVKQEIQLAWHYNVPCFPVLLEPVSYSEQVEYWLTGWQYVELSNEPLHLALPKIVAGLRQMGVGPQHSPRPAHVSELDALWSAARLTDQIWPMPGEAGTGARSGLRDLGAPQEEAQHSFALGSRVRIAIESERDTNLLLLNRGTSGKLYCLCPSKFAPHQRIARGLNTLPQAQSPHPSFVVSGTGGREHLLAILSDEPVGSEWMPSAGTKAPALVLHEPQVDALVRRLREMPGDSWTAIATYFGILAK